MKILSKNQKRVIELMKSGYELGLYSGTRCGSKVYIQEGGCGKGGNSENVKLQTFRALLKHKIIKIKKDGLLNRTYELVQDWKP